MDKELLTAASNAAALLGTVYQLLDRVQANGGATSISGIASCNAMIKSLEANRSLAETLVMEPLRQALANNKEPNQ